MSRSINDIDPVVIPAKRRVLRENGNTAFFFQVIGVHDALDFAEAFTQRAGLFQQFVHQCGFAMVDMGNNGYVSQVCDHGSGRAVRERARIIVAIEQHSYLSRFI